MKRFTRRQVLALGGGLVAAATLSTTGCSSGTSSETAAAGPGPLPPQPNPPVDDFFQPAEFRSSAGVLDVNMECLLADNTLNGQAISTVTYNGTIPGPTLRVNQGDTLRIRLINNLPADPIPDPPFMNMVTNSDITNLHTHGFHVSPKSPSDNIFQVIKPGEIFNYEFQLPGDHPPGTYFYHPHHHSAVAVQMWSGMGGMIIVQGPIDQVPEVAAAREVIMVFQEMRVDAQGVFPTFNFGTFGTDTTQTFVVNGLVRPTLRINSGEIQRWRLLHSGVTDYINLALDGHEFQLISVDGNTLPAPLVQSPHLMAPGNRADILVQGGAPGTYQLKKLAFAGGFAPTPELILADVIVGEATDVPMKFPESLPVPAALTPITDAELTGSRNLTFETIPPPPQLFFTVDNKPFDPDRIDQTVVLGAVEEWTISNSTPEDHPFHIHVNPFQVVAINGVPQAQPIWMDTASIPANGSITIRHRFEDFDGPYVLHCHILLHECMGMMEVVDVIPPGLSPKQLSERKKAHDALVAKIPMSAPDPEYCANPAKAPRRRLRWGKPA